MMGVAYVSLCMLSASSALLSDTWNSLRAIDKESTIIAKIKLYLILFVHYGRPKINQKSLLGC